MLADAAGVETVAGGDEADDASEEQPCRGAEERRSRGEKGPLCPPAPLPLCPSAGSCSKALNQRVTEPVTVGQLRERFGLPSNRRAIGLLKRMRHLREGRDYFTTEEWLAEYVASQAVPSMDWPTLAAPYDPLEEAVIARVVQLIGELAARGHLAVRYYAGGHLAVRPLTPAASISKRRSAPSAAPRS